MNICRANMISRDEVMPETYVLRLESEDLASAQPGQFVHIRIGDSWDPLLRRPMSIFRIHSNGISVLIRDVGRGSHELTRAQVGESLNVMGPLGQPFRLERGSRRLLMVGGGYGVAPLLGLADLALPSGAEVVLLVGAASASYIFPADQAGPSITYRTATVDGTAGHQGFVTELIPKYLAWADQVFACGPTGMLQAVHAQCSARVDLPIQVSMEQQMGCAMGVCLGCVIPTDHGYQRVCRDGPIFESRTVQWGGWNGI